MLSGKEYREMNQKLMPLAKKLAIGEFLDKYPYEVSGGQKQILSCLSGSFRCLLCQLVYTINFLDSIALSYIFSF